MKNLVLLSVIISFISITACNNKGSEYVTYNEEGVPVIDIENITQKGELAFSDLMKDFEITRLETKEECLIYNAFRRYASRNYVVVSTNRKGILLFSREDGSFITKITDYGNGPGEVSPAHQLEYNEMTQTLYVVSDYNSVGIIKVFKLPDAGYSTIKLTTDNRINDIVCKDSIITLAPLYFEENCRVISQTISGRELFRINHTNENNAYYANIYNIDGQLMFYYSYGGNIMYLITNGELVPHSYYSLKGKMYQGMIQEEIGDFALGLQPLNKQLVLGDYSRIIDHQSFDDSDYMRAVFDKRQTFIFNKKKGSAYLIDKIKDDYLGSDKTINTKQSNGLFSQYYEVQELFNLRDKINKDPEADNDIKLRLNTLCDQLDINDNPVFLTAKMK